MSDTKFTPGPWSIVDRGQHEENERDEWKALMADDGRHVAHVCLWGGPDAQADANAHLLAAAPDLYAALRTMLEAFQVTTPKNEAEAMKNINARRIAREVLSKAEGGAK